MFRQFVAILILLCSALDVSAAQSAAHPNILFIFADDQRADTIAALGNANIRTPHLDRLVRRGVAFNRAYMQGGFNAATCVPSRAMLLSARPVFHIDEKLTRDETWPAAFSRAGYTTFISGKWHNTPSSVSLSFQRARQVFTGGMTDPLKAPLSDFDSGKMQPPTVRPKHACETFVDETIAFLREPNTAPFFAYLAFDGPHDPHIVPDDFPVYYDPATLPLPANFLPQHPFDNGEMVIRDEKLLPWPRTPAAIRAMTADYYRYVSYLDMLIGRVLETLDASPYAKNTVVVFTADSGVARGSHGLIGKQNLYEHSVRVPLIIAGPGLPTNRRTDALCYLFDVMPTLGSLAGVKGPATSEGIDFSASLRAPTTPARTSLIFAYQNVQRAYRDERYKLIRYPQINRAQLFDLATDPDELTDLSARPEHAARIKEMYTVLAAELNDVGDTAPLTVEAPRTGAWSPPH